eukprot:scaffold137014_cov31-Tisochrysis_lutea.AAC.4
MQDPHGRGTVMMQCIPAPSTDEGNAVGLGRPAVHAVRAATSDYKRFIASSRVIPSSTMPSTICAHTPRPAEPAPAHKKLMSVSGFPAWRAAAMTPASVTQPVPYTDRGVKIFRDSLACLRQA